MDDDDDVSVVVLEVGGENETWVGGSKTSSCQIMERFSFMRFSINKCNITRYSKGWEIISKAFSVATLLNISLK